MDVQRIQREFLDAQKSFAFVELHPATDGRVFVRVALQTPTQMYVLTVRFPDNYPYEMPKVSVDAPIIASAPHRYPNHVICYLHPSMWNPGVHNLSFVIARAAKWLTKYEIWKQNGGRWPGAEIKH